MKPITKEIRRMYDEEYDRLSDKYKISKPELKVVHYASCTRGSYSPRKNVIKINSTGPHLRETIIHELCHHIMMECFNPKKRKKIGHTKKFWLLCYEFGLDESHYGYGLTKTMERAKIEYLRF